jgi:methyl-accepting chemotaxis protein
MGQSATVSSPATSSGAPSSGVPSHRGQRRLRNFLLDRHFQLKYSGYLVGVSVFLSASLGFILWQTSRELITQTRASVALGEQIVERGRKLLAESEKVNSVVKMNIVQAYADDPALLDVFQSAAGDRDVMLAQGQSQLEANSVALREQSQRIERGYVGLAVMVVSALLLLVLGIGLAGVVVTHKVAGPVFKMKRLLGDLAKGQFRVVARLRKGDELQHFFDAFNDTAAQLNRRQEEEIRQIDGVIELLARAGRDPANVSGARERLLSLRDSMRVSLATHPPGAPKNQSNF